MPLLNPTDTQKLLSILAGNEATTFQGVSHRLESEFAFVDRFRLACVLLCLLQEQGRLTVTQRLSAVFLVIDLSKASSPSQNPFLQLLEQVLHGSHNTAEQAFAAQLLVSFTKALDATPLQVLALLASTDKSSLPSLTATVQQLLRAEQERSSWTQQLSDLEQSPTGSLLLPSGLLQQNGVGDDGPDDSQSKAMGRMEHGRGLMPQLLRPPFPILPTQPGELQWLHPEVEHSLVWDADIGTPGEQLDALRELLQRSLAAPLLPAQQQQVLEDLQADARLIFRSGLTPACVPGLVTHNPVIAVEVLLGVVGRQAGEEWLGQLVAMDMSLHSMEVVNRLTSTTQLAPSFLHLYISNCIVSCQRAQDKHVQNRLVRLLCVFLTSLIRHQVVQVHTLFLEVQAFCIEFSRIREAASLFRLLKQLETGQTIPATDGVADHK